MCSKPTKYICFTTGYNNYCSKYCIENDPKLIKKIQSTKEIRYGDKNYTNRKKSEESCLKKYGFKNVSGSEIIKNKKNKYIFKKLWC